MRFYFNPRSPHGERQQVYYFDLFKNAQFQPTLPARGATRHVRFAAIAETFQPTLPARGATVSFVLSSPSVDISTHAPRTGSDFELLITEAIVHISTHAPRTGSDDISAEINSEGNDFNPRSPHGERRLLRRCLSRGQTFQPTLPARGATRPWWEEATVSKMISTHAPRTGSDQ